ncbi:G-patch domain and KOW motifs-containing protein [Nilaparvata lugens]|uniref:G-patch domain and KOW motifs-containing protein n=1 Tax=Nilaparvata lugens TaxID=108931 RepID=UPI00193EBAEA|nr:G-patch domain and KOW motifs-containing protein [Nilaparvata lugens]
MEKQEKKTISFGFSKLQKAPVIGNKLPTKSDDVVQFIDCLENKSIKVKNEEPKKGLLVIPLNRPDSHSIVQSRIVRRQLKATETETNDASVSGNSCDDLSKTQTSTSKDAANTVESAPENLDQLAAKEILEDLKKAEEKKDEKSTFSVPLASAPVSEKESTLDDYDNIPIAEFGMAMLRGMGWKPGKGIGKNEQLVTAKPPVLRPKGLGLGADKVIQPEKTSESKEETLKLVKGSYIRIIAGSHKDLFGEIMGFDEETGRLIAKMAISGSVLTFNEFMVKAVSKDEYIKNSKVLNVKKYEEFKEKENAGENPKDIIESMKNKASKSDANVGSSRHGSDKTNRGKSDEKDYSRYDRRDRYKESRNRSDRRRSNSYSDNETTSRKSQVKDKRYERRRHSSESDVDNDTRTQKYSKSDRSNIEIRKHNWKAKEKNRSDSSSEDSEREKRRNRRGKQSSSVSDDDNERSKKRKHKNPHHSSEGKRKKTSRDSASSSEEDEEEENYRRRKKNDKEVVRKSSKDYKSRRDGSRYSKDRKKSSKKYSSSSSSSSSEGENIRSSKKSKKRHKKKHHRSRSSS